MFAVKGSWDDDESAEKLNKELFPKKKKKRVVKGEPEEKKGKKRKITEEENEEDTKKKKKLKKKKSESNGILDEKKKKKVGTTEIEKLSRRQKKRKGRANEGETPVKKKRKKSEEGSESDVDKKKDEGEDGTPQKKKRKRKNKKSKNKFLPLVEKEEEKVEEIKKEVPKKKKKKKGEEIEEKTKKRSRDKYAHQPHLVAGKEKVKVEMKKDEVVSKKTRKAKKEEKNVRKLKEIIQQVEKQEVETKKKVKKRKKKARDVDLDTEGSLKVESEEPEVLKSPMKMPFNPEILKKKLAAAKGETIHDVHTDEGRNDLYRKMKKRLSAGSFRYLNEQLYTIPGNEAYDLFAEDRHSFELYHEGYQSQVSKWPLNPVDMMIEYISKKPANLSVADFGCGDAKIAKSIKNPVHSFDLVALNDRVTACDMSDVPMLDMSVHIAVFCLSLMGTNSAEYLAEANRVLYNGGKLLVAEVKSRFEKVGSFVRKMRKIGFNLLDTRDDNKMFVWFEFEKVSESPEVLPEIDLQPCIYKKR